MTKVCFFCGNIGWTGGTERVSSNIANQLEKMNYEVSFLSLYGTSDPFFELSDNIESDVLFDRKLPFKALAPYVSFKLRQYLVEKGIDILIDVDSILSLYSVPAKFNLDIKHIVWEHFNYRSNFGMLSRKLSRVLAAKFSDTVVTLTVRDKNYWESGINCKASIVSIPNPTPFSGINTRHVSGSKVVLSVGRLSHQKGFDLLLKAWEKIEVLAEGWSLIILGDGEDESLLKELSDELKLKNVIFEPFTSDVAKFYANSSIYTMTSRFEGFPMVLLEASSYGLPIVSFNCDTGPDELIVNGKTGILVPDTDVDMFSSELIKLIRDDELRKTMSLEAKREVLKYDIDIIAKRWDGVLQELIRNENP